MSVKWELNAVLVNLRGLQWQRDHLVSISPLSASISYSDDEMSIEGLHLDSFPDVINSLRALEPFGDVTDLRLNIICS